MLTLGIACGCSSRGKGQVVKVSEVMVRKGKKGLQLVRSSVLRIGPPGPSST